jgi:hypothetical protein
MITCDYCDQPATYMSTLASDEPLCTRCAREQYSDWRDCVRKISKRDLAESLAFRPTV